MDELSAPMEGLDLTSMVGERKVASRLAEAGENLKALGLDDTEEPLVYGLGAGKKGATLVRRGCFPI